MARKSTDAYQPDQTSGKGQLILAGVAAVVTIVTMVYLFVAAEPAADDPTTSPSPKAAREGYQPSSGVEDCINCPKMVQMPTGTVVLGLTQQESTSDQVAPIHALTEIPARGVAITDPFAVSSTEVTRGQFADFIADTSHDISGCIVRKENQWIYDDSYSWRDPGFDQTDDHPVVCVSYDDAAEYVLWLQQRTLNPYRLPTEAEWEFIARGGHDQSRPWGDDLNLACDDANVAGTSFANTYGITSERLMFPCDDNHPRTAAVAQFSANGYGLYDLFGNVRERIDGCWTPDHRQPPVGTRPARPEDCQESIVKGGGWSDPPANLRTPRRIRALTTERRADTGFRVVKDLPFNQSPN